MEKIQIPGTQQPQQQQQEAKEKEGGKSGEIPKDIDSYYGKLDGDDDEDDEAIKNLQLLTFEVFGTGLNLVSSDFSRFLIYVFFRFLLHIVLVFRN